MPAIVKSLTADFGATGIATDDASVAFVAFKSWALGWQNAGNSGQIQLTIDGSVGAGIFTTSGAGNPFGNAWVFDGIKSLIVVGVNSPTIQEDPTTHAGIFYGAVYATYGQATFATDVPVPLRGLPSSARVQTVAAGATSVFLTDISRTSTFTVGQWALMGGIDQQGFGFPINPHIFQFLLITAINAGTGEISFSAPLAHAYKSTWPNYSAGGISGPDQGGPGTLYWVGPSWDCDLEFDGLTVSQSSNLTVAKARNVIWRNCAFPTQGAIPSENLTWSAIGSTWSTTSIEVDKLIDTVSMSNCTVNSITAQSGSVNTFTADNLTVTGFLSGVPGKTATITNSPSIAVASAGTTSYGHADKLTYTNCGIATFTAKGAVDSGGINSIGMELAYRMSGGVVKVPKVMSVTGASSGTGGVIRLTLSPGSGGFVTGQKTSVGNTGTGADGVRTLTVVDSTHVELQGTTFAGFTWSTAGTVGIGSVGWAVPDTYFFWSRDFETEKLSQVVDVSDDAFSTLIQTTEVGGFPTIPGAGTLSIRVHPAPNFTMRGCTGCADVVDWSQAPTGYPLFCYTKRSYTGSLVGGSPQVRIWGALKSAKFTVAPADTGGNGTLVLHTLGQFDNFQTVKADGTAQSYGPVLSLKTAAERDVTPAGTSGLQLGDSGFSTGGEALWFTGLVQPFMSTNISGESSALWPTTVIEILTDQGIPFPAQTQVVPLRLRLH